MNELIKIEEREGIKTVVKEGQQTVKARELHNSLGSKQQFSNWIQNRIEKFGFVENVDFVKINEIIYLSTTGQTGIEYYLNLDMAKHLCLVENTEKGREIRQHFIKVEEAFKKQVVSMSPEDIILAQAQALVNQKKRIEKVETRVERIEAQLITSSHDYFTIAGYCSLKGKKIDLRKASELGRRASSMSRKLGYDISSLNDERFGTVHSYHIDILQQVI